MAANIQVARLFTVGFLSIAGMTARSQNVTLTKPVSPKLTVPRPPPRVDLTIPHQPPSVPNEMPVVEHEEHMAFQRAIDGVNGKVDLLSQKVDGMKTTIDGDHTDVQGLKDTRTTITIWGSVVTVVWGIVLFFGREKVLATLQRLLGMHTPLASGPLAINAAVDPPSKSDPTPPTPER